MFDWIFFDLDGTLTDSSQGIINSFIYTYKHFGAEIPNLQKLRSFIGPALHETFKTQFGFSEEKAKYAVKIYREYFSTKGLFENVVFDGIDNLLSELRNSGKKLVVATSKAEIYSVKILEHFNLSKYFAKICGSNEDGSRSKKEEVIEYALSANKISDKSKVLMVGDRMYDIIGAKKNGLKSCGVLFGFGNREELESANADYIAPSVEDLKNICLTTP